MWCHRAHRGAGESVCEGREVLKRHRARGARGRCVAMLLPRRSPNPLLLVICGAAVGAPPVSNPDDGAGMPHTISNCSHPAHQDSRPVHCMESLDLPPTWLGSTLGGTPAHKWLASCARDRRACGALCRRNLKCDHYRRNVIVKFTHPAGWSIIEKAYLDDDKHSERFSTVTARERYTAERDLLLQLEADDIAPHVLATVDHLNIIWLSDAGCATHSGFSEAIKFSKGVTRVLRVLKERAIPLEDIRRRHFCEDSAGHVRIIDFEHAGRRRSNSSFTFPSYRDEAHFVAEWASGLEDRSSNRSRHQLHERQHH